MARRLFPFVVLLILATSGYSQPEFGRYIVTLKSGTDAKAFVKKAERQTGGEIGHVYTHALSGFSIEMPTKALAGLENHPLVASIEDDVPVTLSAQTLPTGLPRSLIDNTAFAIDGVDDKRVDADVAVLDTGIDWEHPDLYVVGGTDCTSRKGNCNPDKNGDDDHYHGTHVAGTIGALDNDIGVVGVAPGVRLWAVKVLNRRGSGYTSGIIAGIDWVVSQGNIEVMNMSLGGSGRSTAYKTAIDNAVASGITVVVAAGNSNQDSNDYSPAYVPSAITVSALADFDGQPGGMGAATCRSDGDDTLADFSNWGSAVDIAAPGVCIYSTYPLEQGSYASISGTSMAAPHVAGAAAVLASNGYNPASIDSALKASGNYNWIDDSGDGVKEPLLDLTGYTPTFVGGEPPGPGNQPPTASFTSTCTELECNFDAGGSSDDAGVITYTWLFGDATTGTGRTLNHAYAAEGSYTVTLTVADAEGLEGSVSEAITVTTGGGGGGGDPLFNVLRYNAGKNWYAVVSSDTPFTGSFDNGASCSAPTTSCESAQQRKKDAVMVFTPDGGNPITITW